MTRGSVQYRCCDPRSSLTQSRSGSQKGPASNATTFQPRRARRWARTLPPAPHPTMARSTSSSSSKRRMSRRRAWFVRVPSFGSSQAEAFRARTLPGRIDLVVVHRRSDARGGGARLRPARPRGPGRPRRRSASPTARAGRRRCSCTRADTRARRSRSRSMPTGASSTRCTRSASTGRTLERPACHATCLVQSWTAWMISC